MDVLGNTTLRGRHELLDNSLTPTLLQVKLKAAYHLCGPRDFQKVGAIALVALCQLNEAVFKSVEGVNESVELGYKTMNSFGNRLRVQPCLVRESIEARKQREEMGAAVTEIGAGVAAIGAGVKDIGADVKFIGADLKDTLKRVKNLEGEVSAPLRDWRTSSVCPTCSLEIEVTELFSRDWPSFGFFIEKEGSKHARS